VPGFAGSASWNVASVRRHCARAGRRFERGRDLPECAGTVTTLEEDAARRGGGE